MYSAVCIGTCIHLALKINKIHRLFSIEKHKMFEERLEFSFFDIAPLFRGIECKITGNIACGAVKVS